MFHVEHYILRGVEMNINSIAPLTTLYICKGVPLDSSYSDTITFADLSSQINYFAGKAKHSMSDCGEIKLQNVIRVSFNANELYDCNYLAFKSNAFNGKWFFCFITQIEYMNPQCSHIHFEIDVMQTWKFDFTINRCLVEREHTTTDNYGEHLVSETVDIGAYVSGPAEKTEFFENYSIVITVVDPPPGVHSMYVFNNSGFIGGLFTGAGYISIPINWGSLKSFEESMDNVQTALDIIQTGNRADNIISIVQMPTEFVETMNITTAKRVRYHGQKYNTAIGAYVPRNKKLLSYPYNFMYVHDGGGGSAIFRYEYFNLSSTCDFFLDCGMSPDPEIILSPINYNDSAVNWDEKITMKGFPQCAYSIDTFRAWLAQKGTSTALGAIGSTVALAGGLASGNGMVAFGGAMGLANSINSVVVASSQPPQNRGHQGNSTMVANLAKNFYFINKHITVEYARIIDDYFDRFGYAVNRLKVPNFSGRPNWNYVKTKEANVTGNVSFDDLSKIKSIFNNGITFWHNPGSVGRYELNNRV